MEEQQRLVASRRAHKAHLTKLLKKITELKEAEIDQNEQLALAGGLLEQLERKSRILSELNEKIFASITTPEDLETDIIEAEDTQSLITETICMTKNFITKSENKTFMKSMNTIEQNQTPSGSNTPETTGNNPTINTESEPVDQPLQEAQGEESTQLNAVSENLPVNINQSNISASSPNTNTTISNSHYSTSRLPKLTLPTFDGNPLSWQSFWDSFHSAVHENPHLSNIQKLNYLRAQLTGEASRSIAGFPLTDSNYPESIKLLQERFGQQHRAVSAHMQALLNIQSPTSTLQSLKDFYDTLETHIRALEALGKSHHAYGDILIPIIHKKLPSDLIKTLTREHSSNEWKLDELRKAIRREISILEVGENDSSEQHQSLIFPQTPTAAFAIGQDPPPEHRLPPSTTVKRVCIYCKGSHHPNNCTAVRDKKQRHKIVKDSKLCFNCLNSNHVVSQCKTKGRCKTCHRKHHTSLCTTERPPPPPPSNQDKTDPKAEVPNQSVHTINTKQTENTETPTTISPTTIQHLSANKLKSTLLKTAISPIEHHGTITNAHILFDEGSHRSFITISLARDVGLTIEREETLSLSTFGGSTTSVRKVEVGTINVKTPTGENIPIEVIVVPQIAAPLQNFATIELHSLPHLKGLTFAHPITNESTFEINLLIGADYYWNVVEAEVIKGPGPTAAKSKIGYLLSGPVPLVNQTSTLNTTILNVMTTKKDDEFELQRFWELDSIGIQPTQKNDTSEFLQHYQDACISLKDGKYHAKLPWKPDQPILPSNARVAEKRTRSMVKRLASDPEKLSMYNDVIVNQCKQGFIEKVENPSTNTGTCHYIPHHAVFKESSTTPLRIVYDCSCRTSNQPSLNDCLITGPPILNDLTAILLRFRRQKYGLTADIEKAFLNIVLNEEDRDATRFFWLSDPKDPSSAFEVYRFKRVLFGATSSPFILNATLDKHLTQFSDPIAERIREDIYVDDLVSGAKDDIEAVSFYTKARMLMSPGGFNLRSWTSNSTALKTMAANENLLNDSTKPKVLGMQWDTINDTLHYTNSVITSESNKATKREVLRTSSKIYDPLGFLNPVVVNSKILMQEIWKTGLPWDELLPPEIQEHWDNVVKELKATTHVQVPRQYFPLTNSLPEDTELHVFVDASLKAYGAAAYVKSSEANLSSFAMAKSRVTPLKQLTLPQLELTAASIGARLCSYLKNILQVTKVFLWTDSQIVLHWLHSTKHLKPYVASRVAEIKSLTSIRDWKYCPTTDNPADLLTRGITTHQLETSKLWKTGPTWLLATPEMWPSWTPSTHLLLTQAEDSEKQENEAITLLDVLKQPGLHNLIEVSNFSSLSRLIRITAYVLRFVKNCRDKQEVKRTGPLAPVERNEATRRLLLNVQQLTYHNEIKFLSSKTTQQVPLVRQLRLFKDKFGLLRSGGRIHNAPVADCTKFPILLPPKHDLTKLIIIEKHERQLHSGVNATLTALRQRYWIPSGRQLVKKIINKCVTCRKICSTSYNPPDPPPLPKSRLQETRPFEITGVDFTGALLVRESRTEIKAYIALFTCATTRAIHLEIVTDMSVPTFMLAFRRFAARKSLPKLMMSDNASTYLSAAEELRKLFKSPTLRESLNRQNVEWQFIPKRAPWFGGFWERLIGLTKMALKKVLGKASVNLVTLQTLAVEIEAILNDRPLTYVSSDIQDEQPLTPAHLLYGRRLTTLPNETLDDDELSDPNFNENEELQRNAKRLVLLLQHFYQRWRQEYLTSLREFHRITGTNRESIKVGDVVQVHDDTPRLTWKLAVVESLIRGRDGHVRAANIRTTSGKTNRPITKLYPLEVRAKTDDHAIKGKDHDKQSDQMTQVVDGISRRPQRTAACKAMEQIRNWIQDLRVPPEDVANDNK